MSLPRLAIFASGGGSNFQAILDRAAAGGLGADVSLLVASSASAGALDRARAAGVPTEVCGPDDDPSVFTDKHAIDLVALAGYMRRIPPDMVASFRHRMVNIHPSLLPAFGGSGMYGARVHEAVVAHGVRITGATVHFVDETYDTGPIILQQAVPVHQDDTPADVAARVLAVEHSLYPEAIQLLAANRLTVHGRRVRIQDA
ncbi:MAG: phosphoribosylglycinamide formyltransferase [Rhodothermales bacterium]